MDLDARKEDLQSEIDHWTSEMNRLDSFIESMGHMRKFIEANTGGNYDADDVMAQFYIDQTVCYFVEKWFLEIKGSYNRAVKELTSLK